MDKIRTLLFGMTGLGNSAFDVLSKHKKINLEAVFTSKRHENPYPYYPCRQLHDVVHEKGISLYEDLILKEAQAIDLVKSLSPDLIVVSTFDQIITNEMVQIPKLGVINIHPSLLPRYRGTTPTVWALINGEEETGVTVHFIENEKIDEGRIILQSRLKIMPGDTDGMLRNKLAELSKETLSKAIDLVLEKDKLSFTTQDESVATYFRKRTVKDAEIDINVPFRQIINLIRAMTPYPGARIWYGGKWHIVKNASILEKAPSVHTNDSKLMIRNNDGYIGFESLDT